MNAHTGMDAVPGRQNSFPKTKGAKSKRQLHLYAHIPQQDQKELEQPFRQASSFHRNITFFARVERPLSCRQHHAGRCRARLRFPLRFHPIEFRMQRARNQAAHRLQQTWQLAPSSQVASHAQSVFDRHLTRSDLPVHSTSQHFVYRRLRRVKPRPGVTIHAKPEARTGTLCGSHCRHVAQETFGQGGVLLGPYLFGVTPILANGSCRLRAKLQFVPLTTTELLPIFCSLELFIRRQINVKHQVPRVTDARRRREPYTNLLRRRRRQTYPNPPQRHPLRLPVRQGPRQGQRELLPLHFCVGFRVAFHPEDRHASLAEPRRLAKKTALHVLRAAVSRALLIIQVHVRELDNDADRGTLSGIRRVRVTTLRPHKALHDSLRPVHQASLNP